MRQRLGRFWYLIYEAYFNCYQQILVVGEFVTSPITVFLQSNSYISFRKELIVYKHFISCNWATLCRLANLNSSTIKQSIILLLRSYTSTPMAGFKARGSIVQFKWQETPEGREFLGGILHRNRRKSFGEYLHKAVSFSWGTTTVTV